MRGAYSPLPTNIAAYFDKSAAEYNRVYDEGMNLRSFIFSERKRVVFEMFDLSGGRVLDIGCGPAVYTDRLSERGLDIYGVDPSEQMIEIAGKKGIKNAQFSVGSMEKLEYDNNFFDGMLCIGVLEYLTDMERGISEAARVVKKNGIAIFTIPSSSSLLNKIDGILFKIAKVVTRLLRIRGNAPVDMEYTLKLIDPAHLKDILIRNGFIVESERSHIFRLSLLNKVLPALSLALSKKMNFVSSPLIGVNYIVRCRKT